MVVAIEAPSERMAWPLPVEQGNADSWATLEWVTGLTIVFQLFFYGIQYSEDWGGCLLWPAEVIASGIEGSKEYFSGAVALMLALTFSDTMKNLQIAQYLVSGLDCSHDGECLQVFRDQ